MQPATTSLFEFGLATAGVSTLTFGNKKMSIDPSLLIIGLLFIVAILIGGPLAAFVFLLRRIKSTIGRCVLSLVFFGVPPAVLLFFGFVGSTEARVSREHSVSLPNTVSRISCEGPFAVTTFGDFSAETTFEIDRKDLDSVLAQFKWKEKSHDYYAENLSTRHAATPRHFGALVAGYAGMSRDGNLALLQVYGIDQARVGISIFTMWN